MDRNESTKLKALSDIASIDVTLEFDNILKQILKTICPAIKALSGTIMLADEESGELKMVSSYGFPDGYPGMVHEEAKKAGVKLTFSPSGIVLETGKYYLVPDIFKEPKTKPWYDLTRELGFSSIIYNPMKIGKNVIGLLNIYWAPESLKTVQELKQKHLRGEIMNQIEVLEIACKNGEHKWIEINNREIRKKDQTMEIHGIARDITENIKLKQELKKSNKQKKLLCNLIEGSRGGRTRAKILKNLIGKSYNAHQLAKSLNLDYKTIRHHLDVLARYGIISRESEGYATLYFISKNSESDLNEIDLGTQND